MAGFRLWEEIGIDDLLTDLTEASAHALERDGVHLDAKTRGHLERAIKRVLNDDLYASPACGTSSLCSPSEEGRAKPWSHESARWGLVSDADPSLWRE